MRYLRYVTAFLAVGFLLIGPSVASAGANRGDFVGRVVELTNAERAKAGLRPLVVSRQLAGAAQDYADVLATTGCFAHTCGPVPQLEQRGERAGYHGWTALGENIAGGQQSPERVVEMWMESPGHRQNILDPAFAEIGVGMATGGQYGIYWAQAFGARGGNAFATPPSNQGEHTEVAGEAE
jgi:uncharacterized protein YkwD